MNYHLKKIKEHLKFEQDSYVIITGGSNIGQQGKVLNIYENKVLFQTEDNQKFTTLKKYAHVVGKQKSEIKIR